MKSIIRPLLIALTSIALCSHSCSNDKKNGHSESTKELKGDLTTKEAILKHLQKESPELTDQDVCIDEAPHFKTYFIVGYFAYDRGCMDSRYFYLGEEITPGKEINQSVLLDNGFKDNPLEVAAYYHKEIIYNNQTILTSVPSNFDSKNHEFEIPKTWEEGGKIYSSFWVQEPGGMLPVNIYHRSVASFSKEGAFLEQQKSSRHTVDIK